MKNVTIKRFFLLGLVVTFFFSFSLNSFAKTSDTIDLAFPFYGHTRVRQGGSEIFLSSDWNVPINSEYSSSVNGSGGTLIFDFFPMSDAVNLYELEHCNFDIPVYNFDIRLDDRMDFRYDGSNLRDLENPFDNFDFDYSYENVDIDFSQETNIYCYNVESGQYVVEGTLIFDNNDIGSIDNWNNMFTSVTASLVNNSNVTIPIGLTAPDFRFYNRGSKDFINFRLCFDIPVSSGYKRIFFQISSKSSNGIPSLKGFEVNTGNIRFQQATNTQTLSILIGSWFDKLISTIRANSVVDENNAQNAADQADEDMVDTVQSEINTIESFEITANNSIQSQINNIDFTIPSSFGNALAAVSFMFTGIFNSLGSYQYVVTVPLILGIMLLLLGRGSFALGKILSSPSKSSKKEGR